MSEKRKTKNKILFLTLNTFSLTGGIEKVCKCVAKALSDSGVPFKLFSLYDKRSDLDTRYLDQQNFRGFKGNAAGFGILSLFNGIRSGKVILSHINLLLFAKLIKLISPQTKIILFAHGIEVWRPLATWKKKFLQQQVELWAVSNFTANRLVEMHQLPVNSIKVINNCLDPFFDLPGNFEKPTVLLQRHNLSVDQPILLTLTRLSSQETYKGYDRVLNAIRLLLKKFPNLHYILAGKADNLEKDRIEKLIDQLNLKNHVTLVGFVKDEELTNYFCLGDIFIMPSTMEGFGIVFIEAAACGAQIIGGNKDGSVDALLNGKLGTLTDPGNEEELASAIEKTLLQKKDSKQIQEMCMANFGYHQYAEQLKKLIIC